MKDTIYRQDAIEAICDNCDEVKASCPHYPCARYVAVEKLPSAQQEPHEIGYSECADAMLKMWIDNVLTDGEYNRIMDKLNAHWAERGENG